MEENSVYRDECPTKNAFSTSDIIDRLPFVEAESISLANRMVTSREAKSIKRHRKSLVNS